MSVKTNLIDQKEYLKKYLSGDKKKKKKDKKRKKDEGRLKIIDDNLFAHIPNDIDEELLLTGEDAPQIVGDVIEVDPSETKAPKWRNIAVKEEPQDGEHETKPDVWGIKKEDRKTKDEFSPTRRKIKKEPVQSQRNGIQEIDSDLSPPRRRRRNDSDSDLSLPRRRRKSVDSDLSLPRRRRRSVSRRTRRERSNDSDLSLPRRRNRAGSSDSDLSLPRRRRGRSPGSRSKRRNTSNERDLSPRRRRHKSRSKERSRNEKHSSRRQISNPEFIRSDNDSDMDIRRRRSREKSTGKVKVKREITTPEICHSGSESTINSKQKNNSGKENIRHTPVRIKEEKLSPPPMKKSRWNKIDDKQNSPPPRNRLDRRSSSPPPSHRGKNTRISSPAKNRNRRKSSSPPPTHRGKNAHSPPRNRNDRKSSSPPPTHKGKSTKTLDGKKAGLQDAQSLKLENEQKRREEERLFEQMSKDVSGRDAEIAVRKSGRKGRRGREAEEEDPEERLKREKREKEKKEVYDRWGKGVKQVEDYRQRMEEEAYEASKPLARYSNDEDLDRYLRDQEHAEDPMLEYMREKKRKQAKEDNVPVIPKYEGPFPENRFGIRPGYRWDGVDRSNGYEKRWFEVRNERRAREEEAYKYSVEDM